MAGTPAEIVQDLLTLYEQFDREQGTKLVTGFMVNIIGEAGEKIMSLIR